MAVKRLRIIAGPNGSGKSTFVNTIKSAPPSPNFTLGYYVNADDLQKEFSDSGEISLSKYGLKINSEQIQNYFRSSTFAPVKLNQPELWKKFSVTNNKLCIKGSKNISAYIAADLAEFIRRYLLDQYLSFSYETVMSDKKKISFLREAKKAGYRIYLYFFATEDPLININRVKIRVKLKGHKVKEDVIRKRYYKSLKNLKAAVKISDRAYLFDNSQTASVLISEITNGKQVRVIDPEKVPNWFVKYLLS